MNTLIISIGGFILILALLLIIRIKTGNKVEIKNADIILALIPIALWLFLTGKIQKFEYGEFKIEAAFVKASESAVAPQITALSQLPIENVAMEAKRGVDRIPALIEHKIQALTFQLGHGGYWGPAIRDYLENLTQHPFLQYIIINNADGSFFGMLNARQIASVFREENNRLNFQLFADWLNSSNKEQLSSLPNFISSENTLDKNSDRRKALQLMETLDVQTLPVIDDNTKFAGIVDRSRLTASMLIDIAERLEQ